MNRIFCFVALFYFLGALSSTEGVTTTNAAELIRKLRTTMKEKGNRCTSGVVDMLFINDNSWVVRCTFYGERFFRVEAATSPTADHEVYTVTLKPDGTLTFERLNGKVEDRFTKRATMIYIKDNRDYDNAFWKAKYHGNDYDFDNQVEIQK